MAEAGCDLYAAFDRDERCPGDECVFHRVPGIEGCALRRWAPEVSRDPIQAAWFLTRRLEAEEARTRRAERFGLPREPRLET